MNNPINPHELGERQPSNTTAQKSQEFLTAVKSGTLEEVRKSLQNPDVDVNVKDHLGQTALRCALRRVATLSVEDQVALVHLLLNDPRTTRDYDQWLEYAKNNILIHRERPMAWIICPANVIKALLKHLRINQNTFRSDLFKRLLQRRDDSILIQAVIAGLDVKASYETYLAAAEVQYQDGQRAQKLMQTLSQAQTKLIQELQAIFQELGEEIDEKEAWSRLQNMPPSLAQLKKLKEETSQQKISGRLLEFGKSGVDEAHILLGKPQKASLIENTIQHPTFLPKIQTLPNELRAQIMEEIEAGHFNRLAQFIETPFEQELDKTPLDNPASPRLSM